MKLVFDLPLGVPELGTPFKCNPLIGAAAVGAGISAIGGLLGNAQQAVYTKEQQKLQSKLNKQEMEHSMGLQRSQQEWLMNSQYGKMASGMKNAGLNPATANGTTPATPSPGSPTTGGVGPAFHGSDLGLAISQGAGIAADLRLKDSQSDLNYAKADDQRFKNSDVYRGLILRGKSEEIALTIAKQHEANSNVSLNYAKVGECASATQKNLSEVGVNVEKQNVLVQEQIESQYRIANILQGIKESDSRIVLNMAQAYQAREIGKLQKHLAHQADTQASLNTALDTESESRTSLNRQIRETEEHRTNKSRLESKAQEIANIALGYETNVLIAIPAEERAKYHAAEMVRGYWMPFNPSGVATGAFVGSVANSGGTPVKVSGFGN